MSQSLPFFNGHVPCCSSTCESLQTVLSGLKIHLKFSENSMENYKEDSDEGCFLQVDVQYLEKLHGLQMIYPFCLKE